MQQQTPRSGAASGSRQAAASSPSLSQASEVLLMPAFDDQPSTQQQPGQQQADHPDLDLDLSPGVPGADEMLEGLVVPRAALSLGSLGGATPGSGGLPEVSQAAVSGPQQQQGQQQDGEEVQQQDMFAGMHLEEVQQQQQQDMFAGMHLEEVQQQQQPIQQDPLQQGQQSMSGTQQGQQQQQRPQQPSPPSRQAGSRPRAAAARRRPAAGKRHFVVDLSEAGTACTILRPAEVRVSCARP